MNQIPWANTTAVFLGTLPLLFVMVWNLIDVKSIKADLLQIRGELAAINDHIAAIRERLATLEERDRLTHPILAK